MSIILPATVACIIYLGNRSDLMQKYRFSKVTNAILILIFVFSIVTSGMAIQGVWQQILG